MQNIITINSCHFWLLGKKKLLGFGQDLDRSCPFLGLLGFSGLLLTDAEEGEMLKPLAAMRQARGEGKRECSCSNLFFYIWHSEYFSLTASRIFGNLPGDFHVEGLGQFIFAHALELLRRDRKAVWHPKCPLTRFADPIHQDCWTLQDTRKEKIAVAVRGSSWDPVVRSMGHGIISSAQSVTWEGWGWGFGVLQNLAVLAIEEICPCRGNRAHFHGVETTTWHYFAILRHDSLEQSDEAAVLWILWQHSQGDFEKFPKCPCCGSHLQQYPIVL